MKVGFVLDDSLDKPDGVQQYVLTLGRWLRSEGHQVHYLVGETHRKDIPHLHSLSRNIQLPFNGNQVSIPLPVSRALVHRLLKREQFDVLHVQMPYSPTLAARLVRAAPLNTAVVGTFHIVPYSWRESLATRLLKVMIWRSLRRFDAIISVSAPAATFARKSWRIRSAIIPNAVNTSLLQAGKKIRKYDDGKINIVFLGRLVERKGCIYLLKAVEELHSKKHLYNVRVLICGKGPLEAELQAYIRKNHLGSIVHLTGFVSETDKAHYLATADIAVFPSLAGESFGIVLLEAMVTGSKVVLAGKNSGYRSVLRARPDQLIVPTNTKVFAKRLQHFIVSAPARRRSYRWQTAQVPQYDIRVVGSEIAKIYTTAIAKRRRS